MSLSFNVKELNSKQKIMTQSLGENALLCCHQGTPCLGPLGHGGHGATTPDKKSVFIALDPPHKC